MKLIKFLPFLIFVIVLISVKFFLFSASPHNYNSDIYNYRSYSLLNNHTDEHGFTLPIVFQSRLGYEMPVISYSYTIFFVFFQKTGITEFIYEIFLTILLSISIFSLSKSKPAIFFINFCPYFLWPGNWTEKIYISLVFFAIKFYQSKNLSALLLVSLLLLFTSSASLPLILIYLITVTVQKKHYNFWKFTLLLLAISIVFLKLFSNLPYSKNYLISQNLNILNNIEYKNAVNQLRGEDNQTFFYKISRLLHNKTAVITSVINYTARSFDPSLWFFNGDKNIPSNRRLIPIFSPFYIFIIFLIPRSFKKLKNIIPALLTASIFIGLNGEVSQSRLLVLIPFMFFVLEISFIKINQSYEYIFIAIAFLFFIPMIKISLNYQPSSALAYSTSSVVGFSEIIASNPNKNIYITDEIYPDLGPQLAYTLKILPAINIKKITETYQPYIRTLNSNLEIISPDDPRLNIEDPKKITASIINSVFLVSASQYQKYNGKSFRIYVPVIYDNKDNPLIYQLNYAIPKK